MPISIFAGTDYWGIYLSCLSYVWLATCVSWIHLSLILRLVVLDLLCSLFYNKNSENSYSSISCTVKDWTKIFWTVSVSLLGDIALIPLDGDVGSRSFVRFWITIVVFGEWHTDPASDHIDPNPATLAPHLLCLSTVHSPVDLTTKANTCLRMKEHKQERERTQPNCRCMIKLTSWGLTNRWMAKLYLID